VRWLFPRLTLVDSLGPITLLQLLGLRHRRSLHRSISFAATGLLSRHTERCEKCEPLVFALTVIDGVSGTRGGLDRFRCTSDACGAGLAGVQARAAQAAAARTTAVAPPHAAAAVGVVGEVVGEGKRVRWGVEARAPLPPRSILKVKNVATSSVAPEVPPVRARNHALHGL
jgi:hypothetical protein